MAIPNSDDVARMVAEYNAPELRHHYCANFCRLGEDIPELEYENLDRISLRLIIALTRIEQVRDDLADIVVGGRIGDAEKKKFRQVLGSSEKYRRPGRRPGAMGREDRPYVSMIQPRSHLRGFSFPKTPLGFCRNILQSDLIQFADPRPPSPKKDWEGTST